MHPHIQYQLTQIRHGDLRSQAERHRIVRNARRADRQSTLRPFPGPGAALRHLLSAVLTGYGSRVRPAAAAPQLPSAPRP